MKYYSIERKSHIFVLNWLKENVKNKVVLDYCCGNGYDSIFIARNGAKKVFGIDISPVSIENCKKRAYLENLDNIISFSVMDGENMEFDDNYFDIINEYGVLHHLYLEKAYSELARVLKPSGKIVCTEALRHNPFIHLYRKLTPKLRTSWEVKHILGKKEIESAKRFFSKIEIHFFHLFTLFAVPFRNTPIFNPLLSFLEELDSHLLKTSCLKWQAWQVVFILSEPKKK